MYSTRLLSKLKLNLTKESYKYKLNKIIIIRRSEWKWLLIIINKINN